MRQLKLITIIGGITLSLSGFLICGATALLPAIYERYDVSPAEHSLRGRIVVFGIISVILITSGLWLFLKGIRKPK